MFNYYLKQMQEKGSLKQILEKYEPQPQVCPDYSGKPLNFGAVFTAFGLLCLGAILAILLFCLEVTLTILGIDLPILHIYGVGDAPPFDETNIWRLLMQKDDQISALQAENQLLKRARN